MPTYKVEFRGYAFATTTVEAEDEHEAAEAAFPNGFPELCAGCSGWSKPWTLEILNDPACWEVVESSAVEATQGRD
jgi:hypothetical protein